MFFVGLDLAWGERRPSGVAVLDAQGTLLLLASVTSDTEVMGAVEPYVREECLVAFDAPLVVRNPTGNRPCEAALNRDFARFDAGAHPVNTAKAELAGEPRAARLARQLRLDPDPWSSSRRRALEVYPHPATVALFALGRTLKYKHKQGRSLGQLRVELARLMDLLEGLAEAEVPLRLAGHQGWRDLVAAVAAATRKSELRWVEDQVDAVLCAYVALFAVRRPEQVTVYGDLTDGYILTPTLPPDLTPTPRVRAAGPSGEAAPATPPDPVRGAVRAYAELQPRLRDVTAGFVSLVTTLLDDAGINYLDVAGRTKSVASFAAKAARVVDGRPVFADPVAEISDQIGIRVITYLPSDVAAVAELLSDQLSVLDDRDMGEETARQGRFGYASRHLLVAARPDADERLRGRRAQVQVRTVLQHAWAEFEHAIRYKGTVPQEHAPELDRRFTLAAGLLELADREFSTIRDLLERTVPARATDEDVSDPRIRSEDLAAFLAAEFADAGWSREDHYAWVSGLLLELGITSLTELAGLLTSVDTHAVTARMEYRYPPGAVRRLDDALLAIFGTRYVELRGNTHRRPLLEARLTRLRPS